MTVLHRVKRSPGTTIRRRPRGAREPGALPRRFAVNVPAVLAPDEPAAPELAAPERTAASRDDFDSLRARARHSTPTQDRALYSCGCGFVFAHEVSTSVACPHCGGTQAW